jgi:iron complex outermembrane receptor protein
LKLIPLIAFLGFSQISVAQECILRLTGYVRNESQDPLSGSTIYLKEAKQGEIAALDGSFTWKGLCAGSYTLVVRFVGYAPQEIKVDLPRESPLLITLTVETQQLNDVTVHQNRLESPVSTSAILTTKELDAVQGKSLGEALQSVSGVNSIQSGPAIFKPVIHGVHSQRILILNNGIRQEGQQWGAEHAPEIDPFTASTITVVKDAGAIKYGTDALGGVIIVTPAELPTSQELGGQVNVIASSNNRSLTYSGMLEGGFTKEGWGWRVQGTGKYAGDSRSADYVLSNTGFRERNFLAAIGYHQEQKGWEVYFSHFQTTIGILRGSSVSSANDLLNAIEREPPQFTVPFTYTILQPRQEVAHNLLKLNGHVTKGQHTLQAQYGLQINQREEFDIRRGGLRDIPALAFDLFTHTLDVEWETSRASRITCRGVNGMIQDNNKLDNTQTLPFIPNFRHYSGGLYWIEQWSGNKIDWEAGVRYDFRFYNVAGFDFLNRLYRSSLAFNNFSATVGGTYKFHSQSKITSTLASAWRPPNVAELYSLGTHQSVAAIEYGLLLDELTTEVKSYETSGVKPEQALKWVNTWEWGTPSFTLEISGYVNYIFNYIYLRPRGVTNTIRGFYPYFRYAQTDASFVGTDVTFQKKWSPSLSTRGKISWLRATDESLNDRLIFIPSNKMDVSFRYDHPPLGQLSQLFLEVKAKYVMRQTRAPRTVSVRTILENKENGIDLLESQPGNFDFIDAPPDYFLLQISTGCRIPIGSSHLDARLSAENLLNTTYREYTNRMRYYADDIGRNVSLSLKYLF